MTIKGGNKRIVCTSTMQYVVSNVRIRAEDGADEYEDVRIRLCLNNFRSVSVLYAGHCIVSAQAGISTASLQRHWQAGTHYILKRKLDIVGVLADVD